MRRRPASRWRRHRLRRRLAVASLLSIAAASLLLEFVGQTRPAPDLVSVAVAAGSIRSGTVLGPDDVVADQVASGSRLAQVGLPQDDVVGRTTIGDLEPGEMLTATRLLSGEGAAPGLATVPVRFDDGQLTAFLEPGMRVDVVWTPDGLGEATSEIIAADARVLQVGDAGESLVDSPPTVLLEVDRAASVRLAGAQRSGSLSVLLR